jgi:predicted transcriptional regulator
MSRAAAAREIPPPLELLCLRSLWSLDEASVKDVQQAVSASRTLAYTTVMTLLERLARKGLVSRRKVGRAFLYAPQSPRDVLRRLALKEFLDTYFEGSADELHEFMLSERRARSSHDPVEYEPEARLDTALL